MDAYDTNDKIAELDQKIEQHPMKTMQFNLKLRKILLMSAFTIRLKQGMSLKNDNVKVVRTNGEAKN